MVRRRGLVLGAIGLSVAAMLATATSVSARPSGQKAAVAGTITFLADTTTQIPYDILIKNFQRVYPDVTVNATYASSVQRPTLLATQFQSGNAPDVFIAYPGYTLPPSVLEHQAAGHLADLSSSPWAKRTPAFAKPLVTVGGKVYGWMARVATPSIVYNKEIFRNLGLTVPKTFAQFLDICRTVRQKSPNLVPLSMSGSQFSTLGGNAVVFASSTVYANDPTWNEKRQRGQTSFQSTPGWRQALQRYVDMKNAGCFSTGVASDTAATTFQQFAPRCSWATTGTSR
jgi:raffinose/stachyose/melibiose transport system substrate-binding protein